MFRPRFLVGSLATLAVISTACLQENAPTAVTVDPGRLELRGLPSKDDLISASIDGTTVSNHTWRIRTR